MTLKNNHPSVNNNLRKTWAVAFTFSVAFGLYPTLYKTMDFMVENFEFSPAHAAIPLVAGAIGAAATKKRSTPPSSLSPVSGEEMSPYEGWLGSLLITATIIL